MKQSPTTTTATTTTTTTILYTMDHNSKLKLQLNSQFPASNSNFQPLFQTSYLLFFTQSYIRFYKST